MKTITLILTFLMTHQVCAAGIADKLFDLTKPGAMTNCDSEALKENEDVSLLNPPSFYYDTNHWLKELRKATERKKLCRKAQVLFHLSYVMTEREYKDFKGLEKVIATLLEGKYFLELQWQVRNYREWYGKNESVEFMQVKSYWPYINQTTKEKRCIGQKGYYIDPKTKKQYDLITEAHLSSNDFIKDFGDSPRAPLVKQHALKIKEAHVFKQVCEVRSKLHVYKNRDKSLVAYNYFPLYKQLATTVANFKETQGIDEAIALLIYLTQKLDQKVQEGVPTGYAYEDHPSEFIYQEDWSHKTIQLKQLLRENFPSSPWTQTREM